MTGTGNALVESTNTKLRVIHRRAYGFRTPEAMIALGMLALGGLCPDLPGRPAPSPRPHDDPRIHHKTHNWATTDPRQLGRLATR
jgi:hypothetical protein